MHDFVFNTKQKKENTNSKNVTPLCTLFQGKKGLTDKVFAQSMYVNAGGPGECLGD